jgi:Na+-transporting NADH:ubiquinone oxidoreductase subunit NqrD
MRELTIAPLMLLKAALLLAIGIVSAALLIAAAPTLSTAVLLALCVWSFSRVYYFAFYVIERYIDPSFRFSGLMSVVLWMMRRRRQPGA